MVGPRAVIHRLLDHLLNGYASALAGRIQVLLSAGRHGDDVQVVDVAARGRAAGHIQGHIGIARHSGLSMVVPWL